jgi:LacI family transcriptional regulator
VKFFPYSVMALSHDVPPLAWSSVANPTPRYTVADVARAAGVSPATAARALGSYGRVGPETRARVRAVAERLGYRPNRVARTMVTGRSLTIGFVSADMENPFFAKTMRGITDIARPLGYEVVIANSEEDPRLERHAVQALLDHGVDGLIVAPTELIRASHLSSAVKSGVPVVLLDRAIAGVNADAVMVDNVRAARAGLERLITLGHRRIGLVATGLGAADPLGHLEGVALDPVHAPTSAARGVGYLTALRAAGLPVRPAWIRSPTYTRQGARDAACSLLDQEEPPSAIFSVDNLLTLGAFEAIQGSGLRFPRDISLLGFDDLEWTTIVRPRLSVVAQPAYDLGAAAARRLLDRLNGDRSTPQLLLLETSLVERDSIRPPGSPGTSRPSIPLIRPSTARGRC